VQPLPVANALLPFIVSGQNIILDQLAAGSMTLPEFLTLECQKLYHSTVSSNITFGSSNSSEFTTTMKRDANPPGLSLRKMSEVKASEFGARDIKNTYLRITLGSDLGYSPGPPYVLRIWPSGHAYVSSFHAAVR
jgi:hypothetical protein